MQLRQRGEDHGDTVDVEADPEMLALTAEIDEKVSTAEKEGEAGNVDESMALMEQAERTWHLRLGVHMSTHTHINLACMYRAAPEEGSNSDPAHPPADWWHGRQATASCVQCLRCQALLQRQR